MMGAIHQMERELRAERAAAGRASARARGKTGGRPRTDVAKLENARVLYENFVRCGQGEAKFWLHPMVHLDNSSGFDARTLRELAEAVEQNATLIERAWNERAHLRFVKLFAGLLLFFMEERAACCGR